MKEALLLVFANKQDIPGAMTPTEVTERLRLAQLKDRMWYVVPSCATTGEGLFEGLVSAHMESLLQKQAANIIGLGMVIEQRQDAAEDAREVTLYRTYLIWLPTSERQCL